jgi:tricarballylate dehydrogenase
MGDRTDTNIDVLVVGSGNAGFCAAASAAQRGRRVRIIDRAPETESGGNSFYTAGAFRFVHGGLEDVRSIIDPDARNADAQLDPYSAERFTDDMFRVTEGRCDPVLTEVLVRESRDVIGWMHDLGIGFRLMFERQSYRDQSGLLVFWGGLAVGSTDGGEGLMRSHQDIAKRLGVEVVHGVQANALIVDGSQVVGIHMADAEGRPGTMYAESVILSAGGFEASPDLRRAYLGPGWENAKVRGTPYNTGIMLGAAIEAGAGAAGDWASCHSVAWDAGGNNESNRELTNRLTRQSYPLGIVVNVDGKRFLDEGADFRNYTYAKYGREILSQPGGIAFQIFDSATRPMLRTEEYDMPGISVTKAETIAALGRATGLNVDQFVHTVEEFNASIDTATRFDPSVKDGLAARTEPPKSNWAVPITEPPFYAFAVTCGITFTFGGLRADPFGRVLRSDGTTMEGLYVCGEMLGGLFSGNYPGGSGLIAGSVFGRRAGQVA